MPGYREIEIEIESLLLPQGNSGPADVEFSQRRRLVLALALESHRTGYEVVAVDQVAETAQLSKTTLYALFGNKEGLLVAAAGDFAAAAGREIEVAAAAERHWGAAVTGGCGALLTAIARDPAPARLAFVEMPAILQDESDLALLERILIVSAGAGNAPAEALEPLARLATLGGMAAPIWDRLVRGRFGEIPGLAPSLAYLAVNAHSGPGEALVQAS